MVLRDYDSKSELSSNSPTPTWRRVEAARPSARAIVRRVPVARAARTAVNNGEQPSGLR